MISERYHLHAFVCDGGVVHPTADVGYTELGDIFVRRPNRCRYAILEDVRSFIVADMFDVQWLDKTQFAMQLGAHHRHTTYDAAIMAASLTYLLVTPDDNHSINGETPDESSTF